MNAEQRKHIAAVVINSVSHDARVLKEADSLAQAGYRVTVYGIQDNRCADPETVRESGVVVKRMEWKSLIFRTKARWRKVAAIGCVAVSAFALIAAGLGWPTSSSLIAWLFVLLAIPSWLVVAGRVWQTAEDAMATANRLAAPTEPEPSAVSVSAKALTNGSTPKAEIATSRMDGDKPIGGLRAKIGWLRDLIGKLRGRYAARLRDAAMAELILRNRPDAVHCHDLQALPVGWRVKKQIKCPLVFDSHELHDDLSNISRWGRWTSQWQQKFYSGRIDGFITVNESIAETMRARYPKLPDCVIIRNATRFNGKLEADDGRLHRAAGLDPSIRILLYQGGFSKHRGLHLLVRSAGLLPEGWALVMMGWGTLEPELRNIARQVDPKGQRVRFVPGAPQSELGQWTAGGSLGVIPYENVCMNHWFCTPNKLWEYPVAGVPILASPFPELKKAVEGNGTGLLLGDPVTPENIADVVASVTDERLAELRANCLRFLKKDNWSLYEARLIALYERLIGAGPPTDTTTAKQPEAGPTIEAERLMKSTASTPATAPAASRE